MGREKREWASKNVTGLESEFSKHPIPSLVDTVCALET